MSQPSASILIVDDEERNCRLLEALLRPEGYSTRTAHSGRAALDLISEQPPDLILLDVMMPEMDGHAVARHLKANAATSNIPIIMVTALIDREARLAGLNSGAEEFLSKPVDRAELWLRVRNLLRLKNLGNQLQQHTANLEQQVLARTESLRASELLFRQMADNISDMFFLIDARTAMLLYVSPAYERISGRACASLYGEACGWYDDVLEADRVGFAGDWQQARAEGDHEFEHRIVRADGAIRIIEARCFAVRNALGELVRVAGVAKDISESRQATQRIAFLNRVYVVLSSINALIVRVGSKQELFREACSIAVEAGGFRMAWIGMLDAELGRIVRIASSGIDSDLSGSIASLLASHELARDTMIGRAMLQKSPIVANTARHDPGVLLASEHARAGIRSIAVLPLLVGDAAVGILALYAAESDFFQSEELQLLGELAGNIAFAIDHLAKQEQLDYLAYYDLLTGLANRTLFVERVAQHLRSNPDDTQQLGVLLVDLARFKNINDSLGRHAGDSLLRQVAAWLTRLVGDASGVARVGADQFALLLPVVGQNADFVRRVEDALDAFAAQPFRLDDGVFRIVAKVGIALFPNHGAEAESLLANAESALKQAKSSGDRQRMFVDGMGATAAGRPTLEHKLRQALDNGEFVLHYQPKVNLASRLPTGAEALIRWNDPNSGLVPPDRFIPVLEETGLIHEVGRWALKQAVLDHQTWRDSGLGSVRIAVNVSPMQLRHGSFLNDIGLAVSSDVAANAIELEITESVIMEDVRLSIATLSAIRAMGVSIAIDDFGTGFSSLSYLAKLPADTLKIDRSFVTDMTINADGVALVSAIINLAHSLKMNVVAEGVETDEQATLLRLLNCDEYQGFVYSAAVPADEFARRFLSSPPPSS